MRSGGKSRCSWTRCCVGACVGERVSGVQVCAIGCVLWVPWGGHAKMCAVLQFGIWRLSYFGRQLEAPKGRASCLAPLSPRARFHSRGRLFHQRQAAGGTIWPKGKEEKKRSTRRLGKTHTHIFRERGQASVTHPAPHQGPGAPTFLVWGEVRAFFSRFLETGPSCLCGARSNRFLLFFPPCPQAPRPRPGCFLWFCCRIGRRP